MLAVPLNDTPPIVLAVSSAVAVAALISQDPEAPPPVLVGASFAISALTKAVVAN
jgi:hypothetical protein